MRRETWGRKPASPWARMAGAIGLLAMGVALGHAPADGAETTKTVRLLTVGNSFARNATRYLPEFAKAAGCELVLVGANPGGCSMERHWTNAALHEADPAKGLLYKDRQGRPASLKALLRSEPFDFVTIQQVSTQSFQPDSYRPYARNLYDYIRKHAPQAEILLHQTWAYRVDHKLFGTTSLTQPLMHAGLKGAYDSMAAELGCRIIPVGDAFERARANPRWGRPPARIRGNDAVTTASAPRDWGLNTADARHANAAGCYLGAAVFMEVLFDRDVRDISYAPGELAPEDAAFLREVAHQAAADRRRRSGKEDAP